MNIKYLRLMVYGLMPVPPDLQYLIDDLRKAIMPSESAWECRNAAGKRCGHAHNDKRKAEACAAKRGDGWIVKPFEPNEPENIPTRRSNE